MMTKTTLTALALAFGQTILASSASAKSNHPGIQGSSSQNGTGNTVVTPNLIKHPVDKSSPIFFSPTPPPLGKPLKGRS